MSWATIIVRSRFIGWWMYISRGTWQSWEFTVLESAETRFMALVTFHTHTLELEPIYRALDASYIKHWRRSPTSRRTPIGELLQPAVPFLTNVRVEHSAYSSHVLVGVGPSLVAGPARRVYCTCCCRYMRAKYILFRKGETIDNLPSNKTHGRVPCLFIHFRGSAINCGVKAWIRSARARLRIYTRLIINTFFFAGK